MVPGDEVRQRGRPLAHQPPGLGWTGCRCIRAGSDQRARFFGAGAWDAAAAWYADMSGKDPGFKTIHDSYMASRGDLASWFKVAEGAYEQYLSSTLVFKPS